MSCGVLLKLNLSENARVFPDCGKMQPTIQVLMRERKEKENDIVDKLSHAIP
jgi:hypothetical protein